MSRTTSVTIGSQLDEFVRSLVASGRYGSSSDVMRSALRLLEQQEDQTAALKAAVDVGNASGECAESLQEIAARVKHRHDV